MLTVDSEYIHAVILLVTSLKSIEIIVHICKRCERTASGDGLVNWASYMWYSSGNIFELFNISVLLINF